MKNLIACLLLLIAFGCSPSDDELELQSEVQNEITEFDFNKMFDAINLADSKLNGNVFNKDENSKASTEGENNGNGVYFVPFYSNNMDCLSFLGSIHMIHCIAVSLRK